MLPTMLPVSSTPAPWSYMPGSTVSLPFTRIEADRDCLHVAPVHDWRRGRISDSRPPHVGAALACVGAARSRFAIARRPDEARDAPVDRRAGHEHLPGHERA